MTITEFILARIAEDEALARKHIATWTDDDGDDASPLTSLRADNEYPWMDIGAGRVLAECEAKRRIVELHSGQHVCWMPDHPIDGEHGETMRDGDCATIRLLTLPYADHPDYDPAWRV